MQLGSELLLDSLGVLTTSLSSSIPPGWAGPVILPKIPRTYNEDRKLRRKRQLVLESRVIT